jgi:nucleotide-binding universal stress UspA family protein
MFSLSRILVATDFSPPSAAAIDYALALASSLGATLRSIAEKVIRASTVPVLVVHLPVSHGDRAQARALSAASVASRSFG